MQQLFSINFKVRRQSYKQDENITKGENLKLLKQPALQICLFFFFLSWFLALNLQIILHTFDTYTTLSFDGGCERVSETFIHLYTNTSRSKIKKIFSFYLKDLNREYVRSPRKLFWVIGHQPPTRQLVETLNIWIVGSSTYNELHKW